MNPARKTQIIAVGISIVPVVTALWISLETADPALAKNSLKIALSVIFAYSLLQRAAWARWVVGILSLFALAISLLLFVNWNLLMYVVYSWDGILILLMHFFYIWTTYTLLVDRSVVAYFKTKQDPEHRNIQQGEQAGSSNGG